MMKSTEFEDRNRILDAVISERRTHRKYTGEPVPDSAILDIIHAGLHAPYAGAALSGSKEYFRKFFVIRQDSQTMKTLQPLIFHEVEEMATELEKAAARNDDFGDIAGGFIRRLAMIVKAGTVPGIGTAPVYVVVAEKKGFPPVEQSSLAHCLENMWLKATALGLGFQLVSVTAQMERIEDFCGLLGLYPGRWGFMGCAIGYAAEVLQPSERPDPAEVTTWLP
jgi:nitroreductase